MNRRIIDMVATLANISHHIHIADLVVLQRLLPLEAETLWVDRAAFFLLSVSIV